MAKPYKSANLIGMASRHMEAYRMPAGLVDMQPEDTGALVLIALYFIEQDVKVSRTKLEAYILMLDRACFKEREVLLFCWKLKGCRIRNFKAITDFMLRRGLILIKGRSYFELAEEGKELAKSFAMLSNIRHWMDKILRDYKGKTGEQALSAVLEAKPTEQYIKALENARRAIDGKDGEGNVVKN